MIRWQWKRLFKLTVRLSRTQLDNIAQTTNSQDTCHLKWSLQKAFLCLKIHVHKLVWYVLIIWKTLTNTFVFIMYRNQIYVFRSNIITSLTDHCSVLCNRTSTEYDSDSSVMRYLEGYFLSQTQTSCSISQYCLLQKQAATL